MDGDFPVFFIGFSPANSATHGEKRDSSGDFHQQKTWKKTSKRPGVSPTPRLLLLDAVGPWPRRERQDARGGGGGGAFSGGFGAKDVLLESKHWKNEWNHDDLVTYSEK